MLAAGTIDCVHRASGSIFVFYLPHNADSPSRYIFSQDTKYSGISERNICRLLPSVAGEKPSVIGLWCPAFGSLRFKILRKAAVSLQAVVRMTGCVDRLAIGAHLDQPVLRYAPNRSFWFTRTHLDQPVSKCSLMCALDLQGTLGPTSYN